MHIHFSLGEGLTHFVYKHLNFRGFFFSLKTCILIALSLPSILTSIHCSCKMNIANSPVFLKSGWLSKGLCLKIDSCLH